jgi:hypothetical protein
LDGELSQGGAWRGSALGFVAGSLDELACLSECFHRVLTPIQPISGYIQPSQAQGFRGAIVTGDFVEQVEHVGPRHFEGRLRILASISHGLDLEAKNGDKTFPAPSVSLDQVLLNGLGFGEE